MSFATIGRRPTYSVKYKDPPDPLLLASTVTSALATLWGTHASPITQETLRLWSATFNHGITYGQYFNHIRKADIMLGKEHTWHNSEIRTIDMGLTNAKYRGFACPQFHPIARHIQDFGTREQPLDHRSMGVRFLSVSPQGTSGNHPTTNGIDR